MATAGVDTFTDQTDTDDLDEKLAKYVAEELSKEPVAPENPQPGLGDIIKSFKRKGGFGRGMGMIAKYIASPEGQQIIGGLISNYKPYAGKYLVDTAQNRMKANQESMAQYNTPISKSDRIKNAIEYLKMNKNYETKVKTSEEKNKIMTQLSNALTDEELESLAKNALMGVSNDPSFGLAANNPLRGRYYAIKAKLTDKLGGTGNVATQKGETKVQTSVPMTTASAGARVQDMKVNQAYSLSQALEQGYDPKTGKIEIAPTMHSEIALGVARMLSPSGQVGVELEEKIRQASVRESLSRLLIMAGADPEKVGGTTPEISNYLKDMIAREGKASQELRDQYTGTRTGFDFKSYVNQSPVFQKKGKKAVRIIVNPKTGEKMQSTDGGKTWQKI